LSHNWFILMAGGGQDSSGSPLLMIVWFGLLIAIFYLLLFRPQRKKQKEHEKLLTELKKGDRVVTTGGMFGTIFAIDDEKNRVVIKIGDNMKLEFLKSSIAGRVEK
jgi:preprotein translocase subunit YajC